MSQDVPERALLWLDPEVAAWLHEEAEHFGGDVEAALNANLTALMRMARSSEPWALLEARLAAQRGWLSQRPVARR